MGECCSSPRGCCNVHPTELTWKVWTFTPTHRGCQRPTPSLWTQHFHPHPSTVARTPHPMFNLLKVKDKEKNLECSHLKKMTP